MFVGCSEISVSVIGKHVQLVGIFETFCLPGDLLSFSVPGGDRKRLLGCGLLVGISTQADPTVTFSNVSGKSLQLYLKLALLHGGFCTFLKLYKWYQIAQSVTRDTAAYRAMSCFNLLYKMEKLSGEMFSLFVLIKNLLLLYETKYSRMLKQTTLLQIF